MRLTSFILWLCWARWVDSEFSDGLESQRPTRERKNPFDDGFHDEDPSGWVILAFVILIIAGAFIF